jgi:hypothetical protein
VAFAKNGEELLAHPSPPILASAAITTWLCSPPDWGTISPVALTFRNATSSRSGEQGILSQPEGSRAMSRACKRCNAAVAAFVLSCLPVVVAHSATPSELDYVKIAQARDGPCTATVKRAGNLFSVHIEGLEPGERFEVVSTSEREEIVIPVEVSYKGIVIIVTAPQVKGYTSGIAHIDFESRRCRIHLSYPWRDDN